jgi:superfamily II DNA or RNA helicase
MTIVLKLTNRQLHIEGASQKTLRAIDKATSYMVSGAQFAPAFQSKRWDGFEHLLKFSKKAGYHVPSGLVVDVLRVLRARGDAYRLTDQTHVKNERRVIAWNPAIVLRDYQHEAVRAIFSGPLPGIGILKMPIRSGKTKTGARIIQKLGLPTLLIVPSQMLLNQTVDALREALPDVPIGKIGDGHFDVAFITVATIQSLQRSFKTRASKKPTERMNWKVLSKFFDVVICDEAHHFGGNSSWHSVLYQIDARYKIALSATLFMNDETQIELGVIWVRGIFGPIRIDLDTSTLVEQGFLMRQNVLMYRVSKPNLEGKRWSQTLRQKGIETNTYRNRMIAKLAEKQVALGRKVLIVSNRLNQISCITDELDGLDLGYRTITSADGSDAREQKVDAFRDGSCSILVGTVLSEGVDLPSVETVIVADGGKSQIGTIQKQRNLTVAKNKTKSILIDFFDDTNGYFRKHSEERLKTYQAESAFNVKLVG